jgi:hypothetical protein
VGRQTIISVTKGSCGSYLSALHSEINIFSPRSSTRPQSMPFDPLVIVGRDVFSADGCVFLDAPPAAAPPPTVDAPGGAVGSEATRPDEQPTFGKLLGVSPRFVARHARSATEATLLMDVASAAAELDVLLESLADQLGDRARILDGLVGVGRQGDSERSNLAHATLLALQGEENRVL